MDVFIGGVYLSMMWVVDGGWNIMAARQYRIVPPGVSDLGGKGGEAPKCNLLLRTVIAHISFILWQFVRQKRVQTAPECFSL